VDADAVRSRLDLRWVLTDDAARWAFRVSVVVAVCAWVVVGRWQWFLRDDWAFLITRDRIRQQAGLDSWLNIGQDGHWMVVPILVWRVLQNVFGIGSYWPYLATMLLVNVGIVAATRQLCRRLGATEWTTTLVCAVLLVLGTGWENIVFAIQLTYNLSLLAFLCHLLLVDHDGPPDRRDALGVAVGLIGVMSSGFGPFFVAGVAIFLVLRQRWTAAAIAVLPCAAAWIWWFLAYGGDPASDTVPGSRVGVSRFVLRGVIAVFEGLLSIPSLAGVALVGTLATVIWAASVRRGGAISITLAATTVIMFAGVGWQRIGFGIESAASSRYVFMGAVLLAPLLAIAIDRLDDLSISLAWAARMTLGLSMVINLALLGSYARDWADRSDEQRAAFELLAGSPLTAGADPTIRPVPFSPDVTIGDIPWLVAEDAIDPRPAVTPEDEALLAAALAGRVGVGVP
jgi:hypothetical protein